jgi:glycosyltransferase involved in cell wall biosynthesis
MRVLHVIARLNVGGTARYITQLANELPKHGIEVLVVAGYVQGAEIEDPTAANIKLVRIKSLGRSINPIKDHLAHKQLQAIIKEFKPDIIHSHTFKAGLVTRAHKQQVPVVHTFHGHLFDDPEFSGFKTSVITAIERYLAKKTTTLVTVGKRVGDELEEKGIGISTQYVNIAPGVKALDVTERNQAFTNLGITDDGREVIGWIARVTGVKNPMRALEVARKLPHIHFLIAGGGDLLDEVKEAAPENVSVLGWVGAEDLFGAADIIVSTSENEGMPIALIEAQLAGKPVVATDVGAVAEVIANHESGLVTNKNAGSIAAALNTLVLDVQKRTQMSALATARAASLFSIDRMVNAHVDLYRSIVS